MIAKSTKVRRPVPPATDSSQLCILVARCRRMLWSSGHRELERHGETMWTWQVLTYLARGEAATQLELATATVQHPAALSRQLAELEAHGLVRRHRDPADRRRMFVELTEAGRQRHDVLRVHVYGATAKRIAVLSAAEQTKLQALLAKLEGGDAERCAAASQPRSGG
jgi:DNA-binding MarR family transcriptional regulator